jgi:hypothetical protein
MILPRAFEAVTISARVSGQFKLLNIAPLQGFWNFEMSLSQILAIYLQ